MRCGQSRILGVVEMNAPFLSESDEAEYECPVPTFEADLIRREAKVYFYYR